MSLILSQFDSKEKCQAVIIGYGMSHGCQKRTQLLDQIKRAFPTKKYKEIIELIIQKDQEYEN